MFFHFLRLTVVATLLVGTFAKKIKDKICIISAFSAGIALLSANLVWHEYRRFLIPAVERTLGSIPDRAIAILLNVSGDVLTFVSLAVLLKLGGRIVLGNCERNSYFAAIDRLRGALPLMLKKMLCIISNFTLVLWTESHSILAKKRLPACASSDGNAIIFTYSRILI